jgi:hypothetical protein
MESPIIHDSSYRASPYSLWLSDSSFAESISSQELLITALYHQKPAIKKYVALSYLKAGAFSLSRGTPDIFADFTDEPLSSRDTQPCDREPDVSPNVVDSAEIFAAMRSLYLSTTQPLNRAIARRIISLYRDALAEDEHMLSASLRQFTAFFVAYPGLGLPKITLTPDGTLRARWIQRAGSFTAIEFVGGEVAKLVAEIPREEGVTAQHFIREHIKHVIKESDTHADWHDDR